MNVYALADNGTEVIVDEFKIYVWRGEAFFGNDYFYGKNNVIQNYESAVYYYRLAAEAGFAKAQNSLGYCYYHGNGVEYDKDIALNWYLKAAEKGNADGMRNVGIYYEEKSNFTRAEEWFNKAKKD